MLNENKLVRAAAPCRKSAVAIEFMCIAFMLKVCGQYGIPGEKALGPPDRPASAQAVDPPELPEDPDAGPFAFPEPFNSLFECSCRQFSGDEPFPFPFPFAYIAL